MGRGFNDTEVVPPPNDLHCWREGPQIDDGSSCEVSISSPVACCRGECMISSWSARYARGL